MFIMGKFLAFLKIVSMAAGVTLSIQVTSDFLKSDIGKKLIGGRKLQKVKSFGLEDEHTTVLGITRHGKTYATMKTLEQCKEGVFFFNQQEEKTPSNFIYADSSVHFEDIYNAIRNKKKINYVPNTNLEIASRELELIVNRIYEKGHLDCRFVVDEVHLLNMGDRQKRGLKACIRVATTGLKRGLKGVWITQRGALLDNTLLNQATKHVLFALGNQDLAYLKSNSFPSEEIGSLANEKYKFVIYDNREVKGAFKIG